MSFLKLVLGAVLIQNVICSVLRTDPTVHTNVGSIKGLKATDGDYSMFLGIPYAKIDKGNPFGASLPYPAFEETFEAYDDSALCPQQDSNLNITGTLDCLQLNVFVPDSADSDNLLPVLVYIHGGFLQRGSFSRADLGPKFLVKHDVILITINYRVGLYGFMCLDTPEVPGNQGLKDQLKALQWIRDNIEAFGGDPAQVTLSGQSAGAAAVDFHLMYSGDRLFNKVILQSGVALTPARLIESDSTKPLQLAEHLGYVTDDLDEALAFLATLDTDSIVNAGIELGLAFRACLEKQFDGVEAFVAQHPADADRPLVENIPVLIGSVDKELMVAYQNRDDDYFLNLNIFMNELNNMFDFGDKLTTIHDNVRKFYIGDHELTVDDKSMVIDFASDYTYVHPIQRGMSKYIESGAENIYYYVFTYNGGRNLAKYLNGLDAPGATHTDELGYLFDPSALTEDPSSEDQVVIDRITTMWTNFVKYGNPTPSTSDLLPTVWSPISSEKWHCLKIDSELTLGERPFHDRLAYWDLFFENYGKFEKGVANA